MVKVLEDREAVVNVRAAHTTLNMAVSAAVAPSVFHPIQHLNQMIRYSFD
jgi:hypothetical protein